MILLPSSTIIIHHDPFGFGLRGHKETPANIAGLQPMFIQMACLGSAEELVYAKLWDVQSHVVLEGQPPLPALLNANPTVQQAMAVLANDTCGNHFPETTHVVQAHPEDSEKSDGSCIVSIPKVRSEVAIFKYE